MNTINETRHFYLATDLDGTFLHGDHRAKETLYKLFETAAESGRKLIYVTGRGLESIYPLLSDPVLPNPDYIIADVGATVVDGVNLEPIHPLQGEIQAKWPGSYKVMDAFRHVPGLIRQEVPQECRCSYYLKDLSHLDRIAQIAASLSCDVLYSADKYLDILPRQISKGTTLQRLLQIIALDPQQVLVAGDTLNDLSLFQTHLKGVAVGNAEPKLVEKIENLPNTYYAKAEGVGGILEGLAHHGFIAAAPIQKLIKSKLKTTTTTPEQMIIVYHRLPFDEERQADQYIQKRHQSPNGIIPTLMRFFANGREGVWVAWSKSEGRQVNSQLAALQPNRKEYPNLNLARVWLSKNDVDIFYQRFSKEAFWLLLHSFTDKLKFDHQHWQHFLEVNRLFAEEVAKQAQPNALVWIHDYNLWMVPGFLRKLRKDLRIAMFHHTPFPAADSFSVIPWRREILSSLLHCDYVGFHIPRYVENFVDALRGHGPLEVLEQEPSAPRYRTYGCAIGSTTQIKKIRSCGHTLSLGAHPVGIDIDLIKTMLKDSATQKKIAELREAFAGRTTILSVERLDYTKGPLQKLAAYEMLLEQHPELREKVQFVTIWTPPDPRMKVYSSLRERVDQLIGKINGTYTTYRWTPIRYFFQSFTFQEILAFYAAADIAWIAPLRDGLNLVAKEYVAAKHLSHSQGVLVLSEYAGASAELHGALLTNPYDITDLKRVLHKAIHLKPETKKLQMQRLFQIISRFDINYWADDFIDAVHQASQEKVDDPQSNRTNFNIH